jgi:hypothetical protein
MLILCIWWAGILLELLLLIRGVQGKLLPRFPLFFSYIFFVFLQSIVLFAIRHWAEPLFKPAYWICQYIALVAGSLLVFEIYRVALRAYPGTSRMARNALFFVFALAVAKVLVYQSNGTLKWLAHAPMELERNVRVVQAFAVLAIACVLLLYAIPCSRHLKGILMGYGLLVGSSVFDLSLLSYFGDSFKMVWTYVQITSYLFFLLIWLVALWSPALEPLARSAPASDNYSEISSDTQEQLAKLRFGLRRAARRC